jgi:F-type H+-transporting ATPase subunit delta
MSELATLARPYAEAAFKRAKETSTSAKWSEFLAYIDAVTGDALVKTVINNPNLGKDKKTQLLQEICGESLDAEMGNFLKLLVQNNRLGLLSHIRKNYELLRAQDEGYIDVAVVSAFSFTKENEKKLSDALGKTLNKKIHMNLTVDKSLIGGVLVRAGDRVIDGSVRGQLQQLQKSLL